MAKSGGDNPFPLSEMMTQGFEQTRKAMENYFDFFEKNVKAAPWLDSDSWPCRPRRFRTRGLNNVAP